MDIPIKDKFKFILDVMGYTYTRVNNKKGIFTYTLLKDPLYVVINKNPDKENEFDFEFFKKVFLEEATIAVQNATKKIRNQEKATKHLAPALAEKPKEFHDSFTVHFVDGNKTNPIKLRKVNLEERGNYLINVLKELWGRDDITGIQYKALKGKLSKKNVTEDSLKEVIRFINKLKSEDSSAPTDMVSRIIVKYNIFCDSEVPYQDWTDPSVFEYIGEINITI